MRRRIFAFIEYIDRSLSMCIWNRRTSGTDDGTRTNAKMGHQCFNGSVLALKPNRVIFDKTGTLTKGVPEVSTLRWLVRRIQNGSTCLLHLKMV